MSSDQHNPATAPTTEPFRYSRAETVRHLHDTHNPDRPPPSARAQARQAGIPRSTLGYWQQRPQRTAAPASLVAFFDSPDGLAFLRQLLLAAHLVFQQTGTAGIRPLCRFLELAGLAPVVAASYGTQQRLATLLQDLLAQYEQEQRQHLAPAMAPKEITAGEDENFHADQPCLVAIEPVSNFILLEAYHPRRDADTWNAALRAAVQGLPVTVVQVTSDLAQGLQAHARDGLGAQHSPDLRHVQADLFKATSLPLHRQTEDARQQHQDAAATTRAWQERYQWHRAGIRPAGRPPDFERPLHDAGVREDFWREQVGRAEQRQEQVRAAVQGLADDYHPFDQHSGQPVTAEALQQRLQTHFAQVEQVARQASLSEPCRQKIAKARRVLPRLVATAAWFWQTLRRQVEALDLAEEVEQVLDEQLLPGLYWEQAAERAQTAADQQRRRTLAQRCLEAAWATGGVLRGLAEDMQEVVRQVCAEGVCRFVRSRSCVEGRNGQLSVHHHGCPTLSPGKLRALTVLHNYFLERPDGSTAAERFFGQKPEDLFGWLLARFPDPPRPAQQPQKTPAGAS